MTLRELVAAIQRKTQGSFPLPSLQFAQRLLKEENTEANKAVYTDSMFLNIGRFIIYILSIPN